MNIKKIIVANLLMFSIAATAQSTRSIGRSYSKKLLEQEKQFDEKKKNSNTNTTQQQAVKTTATTGFREVNVDVPLNKSNDIVIDNNQRAVIIKTWNESKIRIAANTNLSNNNTDALLEDLKIKYTILGTKCLIKIDGLYNTNRNESNSETANTKTVTLYIPKDNKLSIDCKYADVAIVDYIKKVKLNITNGSLDIDEVNHLTLDSKYSSVSINKVESGEIEFINGNLTINNLGDVELDTKYSNIEIGNANKLNFKSTNDEYDIEEANNIEGSKNYGNMRVVQLNSGLQLDGTNADVKIKKINSSVNSIFINDKYADLRLPLKEVKNFNLEFVGTYSTINKSFSLYDNDINRITTTDEKNSSYKAVIGNGSDAKINIACQNCTVDFR